jgi:alpha-1,2-mannosyltransferase
MSNTTLSTPTRRAALAERAERVGLLLLCVVGAALLVRWTYNGFIQGHIDIDVYRAAGSAVLHGKDLYGPDATAHGLPYLYTPFASLLFAPLNLVSIDVMHGLWMITLLTALAAFIWHSLREMAPQVIARHGRPITLLASIGAALMMEPFAQNLKFGQINILVGLAILLDVRRKTGRIPTGVLIGIAAGVKLTPLIFALYFFFTGRRRDAITAGITFVITFVVGLAIAWSSSVDYWTSVAYDVKRVGVAFVTNQSLQGFFTRIVGGPEELSVVYKGVIALITLSVLALAIGAARSGRTRMGAVVCALAMLLGSPISWSHHWVWIIPALLWLGFAEDRPTWGRGAAIAGFVMFCVSPIQWPPRGDNHEYHYSGLYLLEGNAYLAATLVLLAALGVHFLRHRKATRRSTGRIDVAA